MDMVGRDAVVSWSFGGSLWMIGDGWTVEQCP